MCAIVLLSQGVSDPLASKQKKKRKKERKKEEIMFYSTSAFEGPASP
jgi:hypothetical protein